MSKLLLLLIMIGLFSENQQILADTDLIREGETIDAQNIVNIQGSAGQRISFQNRGSLHQSKTSKITMKNESTIEFRNGLIQMAAITAISMYEESKISLSGSSSVEMSDESQMFLARKAEMTLRSGFSGVVLEKKAVLELGYPGIFCATRKLRALKGCIDRFRNRAPMYPLAEPDYTTLELEGGASLKIKEGVTLYVGKESRLFLMKKAKCFVNETFKLVPGTLFLAEGSREPGGIYCPRN